MLIIESLSKNLGEFALTGVSLSVADEIGRASCRERV